MYIICSTVFDSKTVVDEIPFNTSNLINDDQDDEIPFNTSNLINDDQDKDNVQSIQTGVKKNFTYYNKIIL